MQADLPRPVLARGQAQQRQRHAAKAISSTNAVSPLGMSRCLDNCEPNDHEAMAVVSASTPPVLAWNSAPRNSTAMPMLPSAMAATS